jgi:arylsulfatase A-like enzyme
LTVSLQQGDSHQVLWEQVLSAEAAYQEKIWKEGIRVRLPTLPGAEATLVFRTSIFRSDGTSLLPDGNTQIQPFFLGEPHLVPAQIPDQKPLPPIGPDVILISIDTLRADAVSCIGGGKTTPWMDEYFGKQGVIFPNVTAPCNWTLPSHISLFMSQYISRHGVTLHNDMLSPQAVTLAELMTNQGYATAAYVDREFLNYRFGFYQGFGFYDQQGGSFKSILPRCLDWLKSRDRSIPLCLFLHTYDVHDPYDPPQEYRQRFVREGLVPTHPEVSDPARQWEFMIGPSAGTGVMTAADNEYVHALYLAEAAYVDDMLKEFFTTVYQEGLLKEPLVILVSDHGEAFMEHNTWGHGRSLYEEEIRVPILIHFPQEQYAGVRHEDCVSLLDVIPTLFDWLGWARPDFWQGQSLMDRITGTPEPATNRRIYSEFDQIIQTLSSIHFQNKKYIDSQTKARENGKVKTTRRIEAYNLIKDPTEQTNLAGSVMKEATEELDQVAIKLLEMERLRDQEGELQPADLDVSTIEGLQKINYMGGQHLGIEAGE